MSRSPSPAAHWDSLETWLNAMTATVLPRDAGDSEPRDQAQLDTDLDSLMRHDPTQSYNHKEWARIMGNLAHTLVAQARLHERHAINLEQETATLRLQVEEARRDQAKTQSRLDQLLLENEEQDEEETDSEPRKEVEELQTALENLRLDTDQKELKERKARETLTEKLQQGEALLERANNELKERDAKAKACEKHLKAARAEINELIQQKELYKDELDAVHRELKHSYKLQSDPERGTHTTKFSPTGQSAHFSQEHRTVKGSERPPSQISTDSLQEPLPSGKGGAPQTALATYHGMAFKELDKLARNIPTFTPNPAGGHDVHAYLKDIDFHLYTVPHVTPWDRLYLLRITSSRDVRSFLDRQPDSVKADYQQLRQAFIREFSDPDTDQGLITAMSLKQARLETPQAFYTRIRQAYFGSRNDPGMEEDFNFRTLFLRNLHPTVSHHLGVLACPRTMSTQQLRDLAHKAFIKQKIASEKTVKTPSICPITNQHSELALEGTQQHHTNRLSNNESRPFQASRGQRNREGARPKHQSGRSERSYGTPRPPHNQKGGATWETSRRPRQSRTPATRTPSPDSPHRTPSRQASRRSKSKSEPAAKETSESTSETAEILKILQGLLHKKTDKGDKPDSS
ncbi:uncharacterized protein LOC130095569 [Rhinichthys klamathensis goyatoka]|uniref:uncharacterized protein LOC130095569 n=1 Tax=Rhinichthys klamathensis goyatoka TaxID=3034132 RepID=UPI0024B5FED4|nr:uncharacterized protein LOC130095569 [Rhinichthys klamathensis goyatoka]